VDPRRPEALFLALAPFGLMAGLGWSLAWTSGDTAVFLLGLALMLTPVVWAACLLGLRDGEGGGGAAVSRGRLAFALWVATAWAAIVPGTWELEARFTDLRFEAQRAELEAERARLASTPTFAIPGPRETSPVLSPFSEAWVLTDQRAPSVWFLRRRDRAFVHAGETFGPYTAQRCRHLDEGWFDCDF